MSNQGKTIKLKLVFTNYEHCIELTNSDVEIKRMINDARSWLDSDENSVRFTVNDYSTNKTFTLVFRPKKLVAVEILEM